MKFPKLKSNPLKNPTPVVYAVGGVIVLGAGYLGWKAYEDAQAKKKAAKVKYTPAQICEHMLELIVKEKKVEPGDLADETEMKKRLDGCAETIGQLEAMMGGYFQDFARCAMRATTVSGVEGCIAGAVARMPGRF